MAFKIEEAYGTFESRLAELRKQAHSEERRQNGTIAFFDKDGKYIGLVEFPTAGKRGFINIGISSIKKGDTWELIKGARYYTDEPVVNKKQSPILSIPIDKVEYYEKEIKPEGTYKVEITYEDKNGDGIIQKNERTSFLADC